MKKSIVFILALIMTLSPVIFVSAAENEYYLVEGYITQDGEGEITRIELVDDISKVEVKPGKEYAISVYDEDGKLLGNYGVGISFDTAPDLPAAKLDEAQFAVLIPYNKDIIDVYLVDSKDEEISWWFTGESWQKKITGFDVGETGSGFELSWDTELYEDAGDYDVDSSILDFDVYAISKGSGERNVLAYRTKERKLSVPYDWLEPNDTITFVLKSNDTCTTLTAESKEFKTPDGESKDIFDIEKWQDEDTSGNGFLTFLIFILLMIISVGVVIVIHTLYKKRKNYK